MSWTKTRARIAGLRRQNPDADITELQAQLAKEVEEARVRRLLSRAALTDKQRRELAILLLSKERGNDH
jgi:lipoprotein NlpI